MAEIVYVHVPKVYSLFSEELQPLTVTIQKVLCQPPTETGEEIKLENISEKIAPLLTHQEEAMKLLEKGFDFVSTKLFPKGDAVKKEEVQFYTRDIKKALNLLLKDYLYVHSARFRPEIADGKSILITFFASGLKRWVRFFDSLMETIEQKEITNMQKNPYLNKIIAKNAKTTIELTLELSLDGEEALDCWIKKTTKAIKKKKEEAEINYQIARLKRQACVGNDASFLYWLVAWFLLFKCC